MKKLRILKNDTIYFHIIKYLDKVNGNTYSCFNQGYIIRKGQRIYLSDQDLQNWEANKSTYCGGEDAYNLVKQWLNNNSNLDVRYMSDHHNVIVSSEYLNKKEYKNLTK